MTTTTLADWANTCRQKAAACFEDAASAAGDGLDTNAYRERELGCDWQALADLVHGLSLRPDANLYPLYAEAVERLVARLDRP